jgi:hypothetical protein
MASCVWRKQTVGARVVLRRLPRQRVVEDEVAIEELLPLLHLALEDLPEVVLITDDMRREDQ